MKISEQVHDYIADTQNYELEEVLDKLTENIKQMRDENNFQIALDECSIYWGDTEDDYLLCLDEYTREVFKKACELVVNVIESFESEGE